MGWRQLTERRTEEAKRLRRMGIVKDTRNLKVLMPREDGLANTVTTGDVKNSLLVYKPTSLTNMQLKSMKKTMKNQIQGTSEKSKQKKYQTTTYLPQGFLAKLSALLERGEVLKILEVLSSLKLLEYSKRNDLSICSLRM